ncbi:unnamed protein product [Ectocarpus fasciculatus]
MQADEGVPPPEEISCGEQVFDISFHPTMDFLAVGLINGHSNIYKYSSSPGVPSSLVLNMNNHLSSCRGVEFDHSGQGLYTISSDRSIVALNGEGVIVSKRNDAHDNPINKIICMAENSFATGDDAGVVKIWDNRTSKPTSEFTMHHDFVADFCYNPHANVLLSVGGDATLCAYELRSKKNSRQSDEQEAELQCVECIKDGRKVVCGTQDGVIITFSWGRWGDCSDRYPGHPESVDCMLKVDESTLLTGSSDGLVRVVQIQPNSILGVIGDHDTFPVEGMGRSYDGNVLCTYAHDEVLRFWDISMFADDVAEDGGGKTGSNWAPTGIDDDGSSGFETEDSSDSDSDCGPGVGGGRIKIATAAEKFFADL